MAVNGHVQLRDKIDLELQRGTLNSKNVALLVRGGEELLRVGVGAGNASERL